MLSEKHRQGITELLAILENFEQESLNKLPPSLIDFFRKNASKTYTFTLDTSKQIKDLKLKKETKSLLSMLYLYYWCEEENKEAYINLLKENQVKYDESIRSSYNQDSPLFNELTNTKTSDSVSDRNSNNTLYPSIENQNALPLKKESFICKIINKIKNFFKK